MVKAPLLMLTKTGTRAAGTATSDTVKASSLGLIRPHIRVPGLKTKSRGKAKK
jgi:hypothetical protein